jgi:hypothetical protein
LCLLSLLFVSAFLGCGLLLAEDNNAKVSFKDPSKPGRLIVYVTRGDLSIKGVDTPAEVNVVSTATPTQKKEERKDGLRVLSNTAAGFALTVNENVAELSYGKDLWPGEGSSANFEVSVPRNTNLEIENGWGGEINVSRISGDIVIKGMNCEVTMNDLSGGVSVETMNGEINSSFESLNPDKPVSFSSMNGEVTLRLSADAKANVRFRTHNGTILTDFSEDALKTTSEDLGHTDWANIAGQHVKIAARVASDIGKDMAKIARDTAKEIKESASDTDEKKGQETKPSVRIRAPRPPRMPNIPALSGGKMVSGKLNGGGPEISITTMNGNITLRHK